MKKTLAKILHIVVDVLVIFILMVSILVVVLSLTSKSSGVPNVLGYAPLSVQTSSMSGTFEQGDLIICKITNDSSFEYEEGDIVTFPITIDGIDTLNTHRIVDVVEDASITYYQTQGDNPDTNPEPDNDLQTSYTIVAEFTGIVIPGVGNIFSFIRTQLGFFLCVLLPMIIFFIYEAVRVILNLLAYNKEKAVAEVEARVANSELTEEQKRRAIEEYLASIGEKPAEQEKSQTVQTPAQSDSSDESDKA